MNTLMRYNTPVLMSLMCQHAINTGKMVDARQLQRWMSCSKPTALSILDEYTERGYLDRFVTQHRPNARKHHYRPKKSIFKAYRRGEYRDAYKQWINGF